MGNNEKTSSAIHQLGKVPANTRPPEQLKIPLVRNAQRGSARLSEAQRGSATLSELEPLETNSSAPEDGLQVNDEDLPF